MIPARPNLNWYRFSSNGFVFEFEDAGGAFDLSVYDEIEAIALFNFNIQTGTEIPLSISGSTISASLTADETQEIFKRSGEFRIEIRFYYDKALNDFDVLLVPAVRLENAFGNGVTGNGGIVTIKDDVATFTIPDSAKWAALAIKASKLPSNTVVVDAEFEGSAVPKMYGTVEEALAFIRTQTGTWRIVAGNIQVIEGEDYYSLLEEGIIFDSGFEPWQKFIKYGADIDESKMLFTVDESKIPTKLYEGGYEQEPINVWKNFILYGDSFNESDLLFTINESQLVLNINETI